MAKAAPAPQQPPMAYNPRRDSGRHSLLDAGHTYKSLSSDTTASNATSPFSPAVLTFAGSPSMSSHPNSPSLASHRALGIAMSEKSSFSSTSSVPSSPAASPYSPAVQSALKDSCRSSTSSHHSALHPPHSQGSKLPRDLEKQQSPARSTRHSASDRTRSGHRHHSSYGAPEVTEEENMAIEDKAARILIYLSGINCFISFIILMYTFFALIAAVLLQPLRVCTKSISFRQQIIGFLAPTLKIQLAFIYSTCESDNYSAPMLLLVNLLSPLISMGVAGAAWVAAAFWFFNAILGDPDGSDKPKGYNDGRASVLGLRSWWETWLRRPLR